MIKHSSTFLRMTHSKNENSSNFLRMTHSKNENSSNFLRMTHSKNEKHQLKNENSPEIYEK